MADGAVVIRRLADEGEGRGAVEVAVGVARRGVRHGASGGNKTLNSVEVLTEYTIYWNAY